MGLMSTCGGCFSPTERLGGPLFHLSDRFAPQQWHTHARHTNSEACVSSGWVEEQTDTDSPVCVSNANGTLSEGILAGFGIEPSVAALYTDTDGRYTTRTDDIMTVCAIPGSNGCCQLCCVSLSFPHRWLDAAIFPRLCSSFDCRSVERVAGPHKIRCSRGQSGKAGFVTYSRVYSISSSLISPVTARHLSRLPVVAVNTKHLAHPVQHSACMRKVHCTAECVAPSHCCNCPQHPCLGRCGWSYGEDCGGPHRCEANSPHAHDPRCRDFSVTGKVCHLSPPAHI
jgi:hypothetical protein